jgi:hypothetical protein
MKAAVLTIILLIVNVTMTMAQCAMCRSSLENNYSNGSPGIAAGINTGILYLLAIPYLAAMVLGYLWFKSSRNEVKNFS